MTAGVTFSTNCWKLVSARCICLGVREYPAVDPPIVTVTTSYAGANPEVIASQITEPLE